MAASIRVVAKRGKPRRSGTALRERDGTAGAGRLADKGRRCIAAGMAWPPGLPRPRRPDVRVAAVTPQVNLLVLVRRRGATHAPRIRGIAGARQECGC